jgi:succinoglycan biosynthesis transport protein ExoP
VEIRQVLQIVWKRLWLITLGTLVMTSVGFGIAATRPPVYRASISLLVTRGLTGNDAGAISTSEYLASTYQELLTKRPVIEAAAQPLGLDPSEVEEQIQVQLVPDTTLIELTVENNDPYLAMEIANRTVAAFMESSRESGGIRVRDLVVVEPAIVPTEPVGPPAFVYIFLGVFVGSVFSLGLAFFLEYLNESFETSADIKQALDLPTLSTIPRLGRRERSSKLVMLTHPRSPASEAYRALRTNIRFASVGQPLSTLLVTSAQPGEGKTTVTANLGTALAQSGHQVVLIDADLRFPTLHRLFDLPNDIGLTDLLVGDIQNVEECIAQTEIDNLRLIVSGPIPPDPSELLESKQMRAFLEKAKKSAELIILDAPPALMATDAAVIASRVDGVILAIEAKRTSHEQARRAYEILQSVGARTLGVVLTKATTQSTGASYYYYAAREQPTQHPTLKHSASRVTRLR